MGENPTRYTNTKIVSNDKLIKCISSPFHKDLHPLNSEVDELEYIEVQQVPKKVADKKPVQMSIAILQHSKLQFLKYIYWLHKHLTPGSYVLCYADTDSICIGK